MTDLIHDLAYTLGKVEAILELWTDKTADERITEAVAVIKAFHARNQ